MDARACLEMAATVGQLAVPHVGRIISKILNLAATAYKNKAECKELTRDVLVISRQLPYLQQLQGSEVMRQHLGELAGTLQEALELVESCQRTTLPIRVVKAPWEARKYKHVRSKIKLYLDVFPLISHIDAAGRLDELRRQLLAIANHIGACVPSPPGSRFLPQERTDQENGEHRGLVVTAYNRGSTLYDHLQSPLSSSSPVVGSWTKRIEVLLGAARHIQSAPSSIVHGHITSSNILLRGASVITYRPQETYELYQLSAGENGYTDPELLRNRTGRLNPNPASDVYSFGVVMLEALTGLQPVLVHVRATCDCGGEGTKVPTTLVRYVQRFIKDEKMWQLIDKRAAPEPTPRQLEALGLVAHTAACCVRPQRMLRPTMPDVVAKLEQAHELFCSNCASVAYLDG